MRIVAVSDSRGGVHRDDGLDLGALDAHLRDGGRVSDFAAGDRISNRELLELDVDVLVPAAIESQIHAGNVERVRARVIAEGANAPLTPSAEDQLEDRGVLVVPDILANAGGLVVSYFEWVQDLQAFFWDAGEVDRRLESIMVRSYQQVRQISEQQRVSLRGAAYRVAVAKVARATRVRGIYP
jgi:glutamate dehydrogenase (NAD(P)+)